MSLDSLKLLITLRDRSKKELADAQEALRVMFEERVEKAVSSYAYEEGQLVEGYGAAPHGRRFPWNICDDFEILLLQDDIIEVQLRLVDDEGSTFNWTIKLALDPANQEELQEVELKSLEAEYVQRRANHVAARKRELQHELERLERS